MNEEQITEPEVRYTADKLDITIPVKDVKSPVSPGRRKFLGTVTAATVATSTLGVASLLETKAIDAGPLAPNPDGTGLTCGGLTPTQRADRARDIRITAAMRARQIGLIVHPNNGDEASLPNFIGSYTKAMPHNALGEVVPGAFQALCTAMASGAQADFNAIPRGGSRKFTNAQGGLAFDLESRDAANTFLRTAPKFSGPEEAAEMAELYWMACLRDVPFTAYDGHPLAQAAVDDLNTFSDFRGPKVGGTFTIPGGPVTGGTVTPQTLFRDNIPGSTVGPWVSQFFLLNCPFGANNLSQLIRTAAPGVNYMTSYSDWLAVQNGSVPGVDRLDRDFRRYIRNGRDISAWVHIDVLFQAYFHAMLILLGPARNTAVPDVDQFDFGLAAPFDANNPYRMGQPAGLNEIGFTTFGGPHIATLMTEVATRALKAVWFQKWCVHRRLRPEEFGGRIHNHMRGMANYPINSEILNSPVLDLVFSKNGTYLLPMAFPEGSPTHPAYASGHATVAGACTTILKAWFDESYVIPDPVMPAPDGLSLQPWIGAPLTVGGELNKITSNVGQGRNIAGVHWRTDAIEGFKLGERVAISLLQDFVDVYNEDFAGFSLTLFSGQTVTIARNF